jgi:sucrose phosphorylase
LTTPSDQTTFFNFMASHDGVGLRPVEGILSAAEVQALADRVTAHGGLISYRNQPDGSQTPYELNIVYYDALNDPQRAEPQSIETQSRQVDRFLCSQAILLSLAGVPGIYVHSLFGSRNWLAGVAETGRNRTINRRKFQRDALLAELDDVDSVTHQVFHRYCALIGVRTAEAAFHPNAGQQVLELGSGLFALLRTPDAGDPVLCLHNVTDREQRVSVQPADLGFAPQEPLTNLVSGRRYTRNGDGALTLPLEPYAIYWLR